jgi:hypothetical protein
MSFSLSASSEAFGKNKCVAPEAEVARVVQAVDKTLHCESKEKTALRA